MRRAERRIAAAVLSAVLGLIASGNIAAAQTADAAPVGASDQSWDDDWDLVHDPARKLTLASVGFNDGQAIAVRCLDGVFEVLLGGLPPAEGRNRTLLISLNGEEPHEQSWRETGSPGVVGNNLPAPFARRLRGGGVLTVIALQADDQPRRRYDLPLPSSSNGVDAVLTACGRPVVDLRRAGADARNPGADRLEETSPMSWARAPRPQFPEQATSVSSGEALLSCLAMPDGELRLCEVEVERPHGVGFGRAAVRAAHRARTSAYTPAHEADQDGRIIVFMVRFILNGA